MTRRLPPLALLLGLAGLLPFLGAGLWAVTPGGERAVFALAAYGACILSFLGGVHWGFALPEPSGAGERARLGLGVVPAFLGWVALLLVLAVSGEAGLALLLAGFIGTTVVEARGTAAGLVPKGYMRLRWLLSAVVCVVLVAVLALRLLHVPVSL